MQFRMFISYSTADKKFVDQIELLLSREFKKEIEPVISAHRRKIGEDVGKKVLGHIDECELFLVLLTNNSIVNPTVTNELGYATYAFRAGKIKRIIPIVEREVKSSGKEEPINTGIFITPFIESAPYYIDESRWTQSIYEIERYLHIVIEEESKPTADLLVSRAENLDLAGYSWEAAESMRNAAKEYTKSGLIDNAIRSHHESADLYEKSEYLWEAAQSYVLAAKLFEKQKDNESAATEYEKRGDALSDEAEYGWESATAYEKAGDEFTASGNIKQAKICYEKARPIYLRDENEKEANRVINKIKKLK